MAESKTQASGQDPEWAKLRVVDFVSEGFSPTQIAKDYKLPFDVVVAEIDSAVHSGRILRSRVQSTLNKDWLRAIGLLAAHPRKFSPEVIQQHVKSFEPDCDLSVEEVRFYMIYSGREFRAGETYDLLCEIERILHQQIKSILVKKYGEDEGGWWRQGVPEPVRQACVKARESDSEFSGDPPYAYTSLIHLKDILKNQWGVFEHRLPKCVCGSNKTGFLSDLTTLNGIRNRVMHPIRSAPPSEEDFAFAKRMQEVLQLAKWR